MKLNNIYITVLMSIIMCVFLGMSNVAAQDKEKKEEKTEQESEDDSSTEIGRASCRERV